MNRFFLIVSMMALVYSTNLQSQNMQVSEPVDVSDEIDYKLIARYSNQVLLYRQTESKFFVQSFSNNDLQENWVKTIDFEKKDVSPITIIPHKESFFILYYFHKKGNTHIRGKEYNIEAQEIDAFDVGRFEGYHYITSHQIASSKNKKHFLAYLPGTNNAVNIINFDVLSKSTSWQKKFQFADLHYYKEFQQILINNIGDVFMVYNQHNTSKKRNKHQFAIAHISNNKAVKVHHVPFHNYISYDMNIQYDEVNQQLVAAGLYSTKNSVATGIFYFHTNLKTIPLIQTSELEENFMRSLVGTKRKKINGIQNFMICELVLRKDGGALLVAEQRFAYESSGFFYPEESPKSQADYLYENILIASIHPSGKVYWKDVLYKGQSSENDNGRYSSFFAFTTNSNVRFLYNNDISWDTSIFEYVVSGSGNVKRNVVAHQERKNGVLPQLTSSIQVSAREIIAVSERDQQLRLLKINY